MNTCVTRAYRSSRPAFGVAAALVVFMGRSETNTRFRTTVREVEIVAHDYAFSAPSELAAGQATFRFRNEGKVIHELNVALLKDGATSQAVISALNAGTPLKSLIETSVGILIARSGHQSSVGLSTDLLAGRDYLVICRFQDSASAPMHSRMGMVRVVHVAAARAGATPKAPADTITGMDYAFKAPLTLAPGNHTLTFVNSGKVLHEVNVALVRRGVSAPQVVRVMRSNGDVDALIEEWIGVLFAKPGASTAGQLQVVLLPEREYVISCALSDGDGAPAHLTLGMFGSIRTSRRTPNP